MLFTNILVALAAAAFATAQLEETLDGDALDFDCVGNCTAESQTVSGCADEDTTCICNSNNTRANLVECVRLRSQCSPQMAEAVIGFYDKACETHLASVSAAAASATGDPSPSGSGGGPNESIAADNNEDGSATSVKAVWGSIAVAALAALAL